MYSTRLKVYTFSEIFLRLFLHRCPNSLQIHPNFLTNSNFISRERNKKKKKMHDFCFTIPYGLLLVGGGLFGFIHKGSTASLAGGVGTGSLLILAGYLSLNAFGKRKNSYLALAIEIRMLFFHFIFLIIVLSFIDRDLVKLV